MDDCPICLGAPSGAMTIMGCCRKTLHTSCYVQCMRVKNECPMCRAFQEPLSVPTIIPIPVAVEVQRERKLTPCSQVVLCCITSGLLAFIILPSIRYAT